MCRREAKRRSRVRQVMNLPPNKLRKTPVMVIRRRKGRRRVRERRNPQPKMSLVMMMRTWEALTMLLMLARCVRSVAMMMMMRPLGMRM
jgi:hypothetical protein